MTETRDFDAELDFWIIAGTLALILFMVLNVTSCIHNYQMDGPWAGQNPWCA